MIRLNDEFIPPSHELNLSAASLPALVKLLRKGSSDEKREALANLIAREAEDELAACLVSPDASVSELAAAGLWECWLNEEGPEARAVIERGIDLMKAGEFSFAEKIFDDLARLFPGWAEPINKQATVLYLRGEAEDSYELCELVIEMKPHHFGAWHGLALCAVRLRDWDAALAAAIEALRLQPHSGANREIIRLAKSKLR
jgi:tetratricopeptide (TPR) repeat protein